MNNAVEKMAAIARTFSPGSIGIDSRYAASLVFFYFLVDGIVGSMMYNGSLALFFYYYGVNVIEYQRILVLGTMPWIMTPLFGVIASVWPIAGYHKRTYALVAAACLPFAITGIVFSKAAHVALVFLIIVSACLALMNITFDSQYAVMIVSRIATKRLAPFTEGLTMAGAVLGVILVGALSDRAEHAHRIVYGYALCIPLVIPLIVSIVKHPHVVFLGDETTKIKSDLRANLVPDEEEAPKDQKVVTGVKPSPEEILLAVAMAFTSILLVFIAYNVTHENVKITFGITVGLCAMLVLYVSRVFRFTALAGLTTFAFLDSFFYANITAAQDAFYTAPEHCNPGGPNFDLLFYIAWTKTIAYCITLALMIIYIVRAHKWGCRTNILIGILIKIFSSLTDLVIARHWNRAAGFSDTSTFLFGDGMLNVPSGTWNKLTIIIAAFDPEFVKSRGKMVVGKEIFAMAVVSGFQFLGESASRIYGMFLMDLFEIRAQISTGECNFDNYAPLCVCAHVVSALYLIPLAYAILPAR